MRSRLGVYVKVYLRPRSVWAIEENSQTRAGLPYNLTNLDRARLMNDEHGGGTVACADATRREGVEVLRCYR